ncbi:MAG: hypothetical protein AAGH15_13005, partial [Myxococcota bacterium]
VGVEARLEAGDWALAADVGPSLLWARIRVDDTPGPEQPEYPLLGARAVFGGVSMGLRAERGIAPRLRLVMGIRARHALPGGVTLQRAPHPMDPDPVFFRFGTQLGLDVGLRFR